MTRLVEDTHNRSSTTKTNNASSVILEVDDDDIVDNNNEVVLRKNIGRETAAGSPRSMLAKDCVINSEKGERTDFGRSFSVESGSSRSQGVIFIIS